MASKATRLRALALYKELHRLGRDYEPSYDFHGKLRRLFEKNRNLTDDEEIEKALRLGEYIKNGENPCLVFAPQVSIPEADVSSKLYIRRLTDRTSVEHSWRRPNSFHSFTTADSEEESGRIARLCEAHAYEKGQKLPRRAALTVSSMPGILSLEQLYDGLNHANLTYPVDLFCKMRRWCTLRTPA